MDRAALDVAIFLEIPHGGWCPQGRRAEDGAIPQIYQMRETAERDYSIRTEKNVVDSDATLILYGRKMSGGTELTRKLALKHRRPLFCIDLESDEHEQLGKVAKWLDDQAIEVLNVAGPRESSRPGISKKTEQFLVNLLTDRAG